MDKKLIAYWGSTAVFALILALSGVADLVLPEALAQGMANMGYPAYFVQLLGVWKLLGVVAITVPGFQRLKEWAYAGFFFDLSGAVVSHLISGDGLGGAGMPMVLLAIGAASYLLRPTSRVLRSPLATPRGRAVTA